MSLSKPSASWHNVSIRNPGRSEPAAILFSGSMVPAQGPSRLRRSLARFLTYFDMAKNPTHILDTGCDTLYLSDFCGVERATDEIYMATY